MSASPNSKNVTRIADASKTGAAQEAMQNTVRRASKAITEQEARQILGVPENAAWEEILKVRLHFLYFYFLLLSSVIIFS